MHYCDIFVQVPHFSFSKEEVLAVVPKLQEQVGDFANFLVLTR